MDSSHFRLHFNLSKPGLIAFVLLAYTPQITYALNLTDPEESTKAYCYEIKAGSKTLGSTFELKQFANSTHTRILFTQISQTSKSTSETDLTQRLKTNPAVISTLSSTVSSTTKPKTHSISKTVLQIIKSESDEHFSPLKSVYEIYNGPNLMDSKISTFEQKKDKLQISVKDLHSKKIKTFDEPLGLVLNQQMSDLLFARRSITDLSPNEKLIFQTYSESEGRTKQVTTELEGQSDHLVLLHLIEGQKFKTRHTASGQMIASYDLTKNIKLKPCSASSVSTHINSALSHKPFQSLFSSQDREKIKSCCQLF